MFNVSIKQLTHLTNTCPKSTTKPLNNVNRSCYEVFIADFDWYLTVDYPTKQIHAQS